MGQVQHPQGWRRAHTLGMLGVTGAAALLLSASNSAWAGELDPPCSEVAANCQVGDLAASVLALGSNGSTIFTADNIVPSASGPATSFCFWAIYNSNIPGTDNIVISFYADTVTSTSVAGYPTGAALATYGTADLSVTRADTTLDFAGLDIYEYQVTYTGGSPHNLTAGQCEWIEISNAVAPADAWFILCADNTAGLGDQRSMQRGATVAWVYNDAVVGSDIALCVNGGINTPPAACAIPTSCGTGSACNETNAVGGCTDPECCTLVCIQEPLCCAVEWDAICVDIAINGVACAVAPYNCAGGGPANDCATSPTTIVVDGGPVAFDLTTANTDGASIGVACNGGDSPATFDVWYKITAPGDGMITASTCATDVATDLVLNVHDIGNGVYDPQDVLDEANWLTCDDDGCCPDSFGCPSVKTFDVIGGNQYLIRVGTWNASTPGPGFIDVTYSPEVAIWNTGDTVAGLLNGTATRLGFSSGNLGGTSPQRWQAHPFSLPAVPAGGSVWHITKLNAQGFTPAGSTNETLNYVVWSRTGIGQAAGAPVNGDQVVTGMATFPTPVGDDHLIEVDFNLAPGDYWMTFYAAGNVAPNNFAWFQNAQNGPDGIPNLADGSTAIPVGTPFMWRAFCVTPDSFPACGANPQGFQAYTAAGWTVDAGQNPDLLYTASFKVIGEPGMEEVTCPADTVDSATFMPPADGIVDGADLAVLLGDWSPSPCGASCATDTVTSSTFQPPPDGVVDGADLAVLLGAWGNPGCPNGFP